LETGWFMSVTTSAALAAAATVAWHTSAAGDATRYVVAVAMVGMVSLLVAVSAGPWQIDLHMYYFAAFAMLAAYCDWRTIAVAAGAMLASADALQAESSALRRKVDEFLANVRAA
jgi:methyl-accepting chemotaxis protein